MRENRTYGSEGGEDGSPSLPLSGQRPGTIHDHHAQNRNGKHPRDRKGLA